MEIPEIPQHLARWCELPLFGARLGAAELKGLCAQAAEIGLAALVLPSGRVMQARDQLEETEVKIVAAVGFPAGNMDADAKRYEAEVALDNGAHEIELLLGVSSLGDIARAVREIRDVAASMDEAPLRLAIPLHTLQPSETDAFIKIIEETGPDMVCLDHAPGAMPSLPLVLQTLRKQLSSKVQIKACALPSDAAALEALLNAGAMRLGLIV